MQYLRVKNWERFQQYKDRKPKWIKLYVETLDKYQADGSLAPLRQLSDGAYRLCTLLWLLRTRCDELPYDPAWIGEQTGFRPKNLDSLLQELVTLDLVSVYQNRTGSVQNCTELYQNRTSETETDTDTETDISSNGHEEIQAVYRHYLAKRGLTEAQYTLTPKRRLKIVARLKEFDPAALCQAIDACLASKFHMGDNPQGRMYCDLADHILHSTEKVERWLTDWRSKC